MAYYDAQGNLVEDIEDPETYEVSTVPVTAPNASDYGPVPGAGSRDGEMSNGAGYAEAQVAYSEKALEALAGKSAEIHATAFNEENGWGQNLGFGRNQGANPLKMGRGGSNPTRPGGGNPNPPSRQSRFGSSYQNPGQGGNSQGGTPPPPKVIPTTTSDKLVKPRPMSQRY